MSWEAAGVLVALIVGLAGLIVGGLSLRRSGDANSIAADAGTSSRQAVEKADKANRIAHEANDIGREATEHSRRSADAAIQAVAIAEESNRLQRQGLSLEEARHRAVLSANLDVMFLAANEADKSFAFRVENKGPQEAKKVSVVYRDGDEDEVLVPGTDLLPGHYLTPKSSLGGIYGAGKVTMSSDMRVLPIPLGAREGELRIAYRDGNGPQLLKKRVLWSDAPFFSQREISVEDYPDEPTA